jgi:hypothetical protein
MASNAASARRYTDGTFVEAVREGQTDSWPMPTRDVVEAVGCSHSTAHRRLHALADAGRLERGRLGPAFLWKTPECDALEEYFE